MGAVRNKIYLKNLEEIMSFIPKGLSRKDAFDALGNLSLESNLDRGKLSLENSWFAEHRSLESSIEINADESILVFITSGGVRVDSEEKSSEYVKSGDQVLIAAGVKTKLLPIVEYGETRFFALSTGFELSQVTTEVLDGSTAQAPYYWGYDKRYAQTYAEGGTTWETMEPNEIVVRMVPELIIDKLNDEILDLGCGEGRDTIWLASQGFSVTGVDVSEAALDKARDLAKLNGLSPNFIERDVVSLRGLKEESFSVALNMGCLHMMDSDEHRVKHLARTFSLLKPGGTFILNHCKKDWGKGFWSLDDYETIENAQFGDIIPRKIRLSDGTTKDVMMEVLHNKVMSGDELRAELEKAGFVDTEVLEEDKFTFGNSAIVICRRPT